MRRSLIEKLFNRLLTFRSIQEETYEDVARTWHIPSPANSGQIPWLIRNVELPGKHIWIARPNMPREKELIDLLHETCAQMGIKRIPRLFIYADYIPNAASEPYTGSILFSTNLLEIMTRDEIKAAMGHELTHHKHSARDVTVELGSAGISLVGGYAAGLAAWRYIMNKGSGILRVDNVFKPKGWGLYILASMASSSTFIGINTLVGHFQKAYQRWCETQADDGGAKVAGTQAMIDSLRVLDARAHEIVKEKNEARKDSIAWGETAPIPDPEDPRKKEERDHPLDSERIDHLKKKASPDFVDQHSGKTPTRRQDGFVDQYADSRENPQFTPSR